MNFTIEKSTSAEPLPIALSAHEWLKLTSAMVAKVAPERRKELFLALVREFRYAGAIMAEVEDVRRVVEFKEWF